MKHHGELVDILLPPTFKISGRVKTKEEAYDDGDWIATFNLWIFQSKPVPAIIYQKRSANSTLAPSTLDVTAGGHYQTGEAMFDGLREVDEELGKHYIKKEVKFLGKRIYIDYDIKNRLRHNLVHVFYTIDNSLLWDYSLDKNEVDSLVICPLKSLLKLHQNKRFSFKAKGLDNQKNKILIDVNQRVISYNWDNYHYKIALIADNILNKKNNIFI